MNEFKIEKQMLSDKISYFEARAAFLNLPSKEYIRKQLKNDFNIKSKSLNEQQRIIKAYVHNIVVFPDITEIYLDVDTINGAGGN